MLNKSPNPTHGFPYHLNEGKVEIPRKKKKKKKSTGRAGFLVKEDQQTELVCLFVRRDDVYFDYCLPPLVKEDEKEDTMVVSIVTWVR